MDTKTTAFFGLDPGKTGSPVLIHSAGHEFLEWPGDPFLAAGTLREWLQVYYIRLASFEKVGAGPDRGGVSKFTFGQNLET